MSQPSSGIVQCPSCGQKALPMQSRCLHCNTRLRDPKSDAPTDEYVLPSPDDELPPPSVADGKCPGCGKEMAAAAVLCIDCGYDLRTGRKRETVHGAAEVEPEPEPRRRPRKRGREPLPTGFAVVRLGLAFHYARLVLTLLSLLMGLLAYGAAVKPKEGDWGAAFVAWILFMLFLRRLALLLDRPGEADEAMALITRGVALLVGVPLLLVLLYCVAFLSSTQAVALALLLVGGLIVVVQFVFVLLLFFSILGNLQTLRGAIASRLTPSEPEA